MDRKGPAPGRSSLSEPAASSIPRKPAGSAAPASLPVLEASEGSASSVGAATSPETSHPDGELQHHSCIQCCLDAAFMGRFVFFLEL